MLLNHNALNYFAILKLLNNALYTLSCLLYEQSYDLMTFTLRTIHNDFPPHDVNGFSL